MASDPNIQTKVQETSGGDEQVVASGGRLIIENGGTIDIQAGAVHKLSGATVTGVVGGTHVVSSGEGTAHTLTIATGVTIAAPLVQILRTNKDITGDATITWTAGNLTVASGSTYVMAAGDVVNWMAVAA